MVTTMFVPCALHGVEASFLAKGSLLKLRAAILSAVWSRRQPVASAGAVFDMLDGPQGCDLAFCVVWFRFRLLRRCLACGPPEVGTVYRLLERVQERCPGHGPIHSVVASAVGKCFE